MSWRGGAGSDQWSPIAVARSPVRPDDGLDRAIIRRIARTAPRRRVSALCRPAWPYENGTSAFLTKWVRPLLAVNCWAHAIASASWA